jgi:uncharacterized protein (TIGR01777 family)
VKVVLTGASGLLGPALAASLRADGHDVLRLVRRDPAAADEASWDPYAGTVDPKALVGADAVVHMAGVGIGDKPWTPSHKRAVMDSRVQGTTTIAMAVAEHGVPALVSMSGIGYYGNPGDTVCDEESPRGSSYLADVVAAWEASTEPAAEAGARVVCARTALVVSAHGGAFDRLLLLFRLGLGGKVGSGRQWWSWVALDDYVRAMRFLLDSTIAGPVNISAPEPLRNSELTAAMGRVLHRPTLFTAPGFLLKVPFGDFGKDLLGGQRVVPARLQEGGFEFAHPTLPPLTGAPRRRPATSRVARPGRAPRSTSVRRGPPVGPRPGRGHRPAGTPGARRSRGAGPGRVTGRPAAPRSCRAADRRPGLRRERAGTALRYRGDPLASRAGRRPTVPPRRRRRRPGTARRPARPARRPIPRPDRCRPAAPPGSRMTSMSGSARAVMPARREHSFPPGAVRPRPRPTSRR